MSLPAPEWGESQTDPRLPDRATNLKRTGKASYHPDVLAYAQKCGITRTRALDNLQRLYDDSMARAIDDEEFTPVLTRIVGKRTANVDPNGDRIARRLSRNAT